MRYILLAIIGSLAAIFLYPIAVKAGAWTAEKWKELNDESDTLKYNGEELDDEPEIDEQ